jgi:hypothetical protein
MHNNSISSVFSSESSEELISVFSNSNNDHDFQSSTPQPIRVATNNAECLINRSLDPSNRQDNRYEPYRRVCLLILCFIYYEHFIFIKLYKKTCRCGSTTHLRITNANCPLNNRGQNQNQAVYILHFLYAFCY